MSSTIDGAIADAAHRASQVGGGTTLVGWLTSSQASVVAGIVIGISGLLIQWYYRRKQDKREQEEHDRRMGMPP